MSKTSIALATVLAATALALGACGDDEEDSGGGATTTTESSGSSGGGGSGGGETLTLTADAGGELTWEPKELTAKAGSVTITMDNPSDVPHAVELEGNGVEEVGETVTKGGKSTVTADLEAGTYEYYCPVGNHKDAGMDGTLTVE